MDVVFQSLIAQNGIAEESQNKKEDSSAVSKKKDSSLGGTISNMEIDITNDDIESNSEEFQLVVQLMLDEGNEIINPVVLDNGHSKSIFDDSKEYKDDGDDDVEKGTDNDDGIDNDNNDGINYELEAHTYADLGLAELHHKEDDANSKPNEKVRKPEVEGRKRCNLHST